jgi:cell pole-organizing protein PopZ
MEEILASIRRIISEDEAPSEAEGEGAAAPAAAEAPEALPDFDMPEAPPVVLHHDEEDVLELTDRLDVDAPALPPAIPSIGDLDVVAPPPRFEMPADLPPLADHEPLVGEPAARSAASAFEALERGILMPPVGRTLEDVVREMLRPMMKAWLDENLPGIVEAQVAAEVERIARLRRG